MQARTDAVSMRFAAVHLVLHRLHGDAGEDGRRLDALRRAGLAVAGLEAELQDLVQRVLDAGQGLRGIVVLVVDVDIVVGDRLADRVGEQDFVHVALRGLGGELHHHAGRSIGVHVGVLAGDVQLVFDDVLDFLHGHLLLLEGGDRVGDLGGEDDVFARLCHIHRLQDGCNNLLVVELDVSSVAFEYTFHHSVSIS